MKDGGAAGQDVDVTSVVIIVEPEGAFAVGFDREIAASHAEIIAARWIHVEGSGALAENQTRGTRAIIERKVEKLKNGVLVEKGHGAVLKFDFGAAVVRGNHVPLADRQVGLGLLPLCRLVSEGISMGLSRKAHIALHETEPNDTGVAGVCGGRMDTGQKGEEQEGKDRTKSGAKTHVSPPSATLAEQLCR